MGRVEAVVFASAQPVLRENLAEVVGKACNLDLIFDDIKDKLRGRPYEIVAAAGGWSFRTKLGFDAAIRSVLGGPEKSELIARERADPDGNRVFPADHPRRAFAVVGAGGFQRRDRRAARGRPDIRWTAQPDARRALRLCHDARVLGGTGFESLRDMPDIEKLQDAGLLGRTGAGPPRGRLWRPS